MANWFREFQSKILTESASDAIADFHAWLGLQPWNNLVRVTLKKNWLEPNDIHLESMSVRNGEKGNGYGKAIMQKLIELSNEYEIPLTLEASEESEDSEWIQDWYQKLGFEYSDDGYGEYGPYMVRKPT